MTPRDPQGAETRTEWRNVYQDGEHVRVGSLGLAQESLDGEFKYLRSLKGFEGLTRIAIERIETVTTITRYPIPPHAGEETK